MPDQNWLQKILSGTFDQRGGVWVGLGTFTVILMAWVEFVMSGVKRAALNAAGLPIMQDNVVVTLPGWHPSAPSWWIVGTTCIYVVILGFFVMSKSGTYFVDSKYNSPPDKPPEVK